eukprot:3390116-Rhodomonas_salina.1
MQTSSTPVEPLRTHPRPSIYPNTTHPLPNTTHPLPNTTHPLSNPKDPRPNPKDPRALPQTLVLSLRDASPRGDEDLGVEKAVAEALAPLCAPDALLERALNHAATLQHVMAFSRQQTLNSLFGLISAAVN